MTRKVQWWMGSPGPPCPLLFLLTSLLSTTPVSPNYVDHKGTSFLFSFIENRYLVDEPIPKVFLVAATEETATVTVSVMVFPESYDKTILTVHPGTGVEHSFPYETHMIDDGSNFKGILGDEETREGYKQCEDKVENSDETVYIESDKPIVVQAASLNDLSSDAFLVLPTISLGTHYVVLSYVFTKSSQQRQGPSSVGITALEETSVTLEIPNPEELDTSSSQIERLLSGNVMSFTLLKHESFQIRSKYEHDLTGVKITSDLPVSVVAGSKWTSVGSELMGDHLVENLPPVNTWGTTFYTVPIANRTAGDVIRVLGYTPQTQLKVLSSVNGDTNVKDYHLNSMGFVDLDNPSNTTLMIMSNKRVLVAQLCKSHSADNNRNSDPFLMLVPPKSQYTNNYHFMTVSSRSGSTYNNYLSIVSETAQRDDLILNNMVISQDDLEWGWVQVASSSMSAAILILQNGTYHLTHKDPNVVFGAQMYGLKFQESYGLPLGQKYRALTYKEICLSLDQEQEDFFDNDCDGLFDEEILNGIDDDGDGLIDEDVYNEHRARPQDGSLVDARTVQTAIDVTHDGSDGGHVSVEASTVAKQDTTSVLGTTMGNVQTTFMHTTTQARTSVGAVDGHPSTDSLSTKEINIPTTTVHEEASSPSSTAIDNPTTTAKVDGTPTVGPPTIGTTNNPETTIGTTMAPILSSPPAFPGTVSSTEQSTTSIREGVLVSSTFTASKRPLTSQTRTTESHPTSEMTTSSLLQMMTSASSHMAIKHENDETTAAVTTETLLKSTTSDKKDRTPQETESPSQSPSTLKTQSSPTITLPSTPPPIEGDPLMMIIPLAILGGIPFIFVIVLIVKTVIAVKRPKNNGQVQPVAPPPAAAKAPHKPPVVVLKSKTYQPPVFDARNS